MTDLESTDALLCDDDNDIEDYNLDQEEEAELLRDDDDILTCQVDPLEEDEDEDSHRDKFASERSNEQQPQEQERAQQFFPRNNKPDYSQSNHGMQRVIKKPLLPLHGGKGRGRGGNYLNKGNRIPTGKCYVHPSLLKGKKPVQSVQPWLNQMNPQPFEPERRVTTVNAFQQPRFQPPAHCQPQQYQMPLNNHPEPNVLQFGPPMNQGNNWQQPNQHQIPQHQENYYDSPGAQQQCYPVNPQNQFNPQRQQQPIQPPFQQHNSNNFYQNPNPQSFNLNSNFAQSYPQHQNQPHFQPQQQQNYQPPLFQPPQHHAQPSNSNQYYEPYCPPHNNHNPTFIPPQPPHLQGPSPQRFVNQNHQGQMQVQVRPNRFPPPQQQHQQQQQQHHHCNWKSPHQHFPSGASGFRGRGRGFHQNRFNQSGRGQRTFVHRGVGGGGEHGGNQFKRRNENWGVQCQQDYEKRKYFNQNQNYEEYEEQQQEEEVYEDYSASNQVIEENTSQDYDDEDEDEATKAYRLKIEEQKRKREEILAEKERNRRLAILRKTGQVSDILTIPPSQPSSTQPRKAPQRVIANSNLRVLTRLDNTSTTSQINTKPSHVAAPSVIDKPNPSKDFLATRKVISNDSSMLDTSIVVVRNLAASSTAIQLRKLCQGVGHVQSLEMSSKERQAKIRFNSVASAHAFYKKYQRHMLDLSMIQVELIADTNQTNL